MENVLPEISFHLPQLEGKKSPEYKHLRNRCYPSLGNALKIVVICIQFTTLAIPPIEVKDMSRVFSSGVELYKKYKATRFVIGKEDFVNKTITKN